MRRFARTFGPAAALMLVMTAAACGGGSGSESESTDAESTTTPSSDAGGGGGDADLLVWTDSLKIDAVTEVAETFGEANGITVKVQAISEDLQGSFVTADAAGNGPDVVVGAHDWMGNLVQNGAIDPLNLTPEELSGYSEKAVQATTYDGKLYGVPYGIEALALYRNTEVVPDEPATMDDAIAAGTAAVKSGKVESALNLPVGELGDAYHMEPILTSFGGYIFAYDDATGYDAEDVGIGKEGSVKAAEQISRLAKAKVLRTSISSDNSIALFTSGKAAYLVSGPWALADVKDAGFDYAIQPVPGFDGQQEASPFMGAQAFMVAANGKNKDIAQEFVNNGVNNEEAMLTLFEGTQLPPAMTSVQDQVDDPDLAVFTEAANGAAPMPAIPAMASVWEPLGKAYSAIVSGKDPVSTITSAGDTINKAIADAG
ncbi:arabinogalactan oligomer / maltooligosaccharide transport system substrate-binding protein [Nocardioides alpinus]|uniref:Arabinogalactan oligomer / maltooligosaccharide transport system substrate-binding protein n=1 Tax=Nocardioides alpinus TaxID=748909 RepID=A0A1I1B3J9_9ACTN|nr:maltose ABC transporter substrate-binding protein [Nocardioides alpinus]PKH39621.1 maltose ABC transporter substrate-binding protein [Nocardioides alpinus]SFB44945.1 arabinogalactan oligomer / maltooligosaccharide transport system substrate-binding protein [Nocardioides alpinus]